MTDGTRYGNSVTHIHTHSFQFIQPILQSFDSIYHETPFQMGQEIDRGVHWTIAYQKKKKTDMINLNEPVPFLSVVHSVN